MKQALEALESKYIVNCGAWRVQQDQAITALRQALETEQESVECMCGICKLGKRKWVGLTDEEINSVRHKRDWTAPWTDLAFARAIEAKLKEKNA
jgi:hypothetical protein